MQFFRAIFRCHSTRLAARVFGPTRNALRLVSVPKTPADHPALPFKPLFCSNSFRLAWEGILRCILTGFGADAWWWRPLKKGFTHKLLLVEWASVCIPTRAISPLGSSFIFVVVLEVPFRHRSDSRATRPLPHDCLLAFRPFCLPSWGSAALQN